MQEHRQSKNSPNHDCENEPSRISSENHITSDGDLDIWLLD